MLPKDSQRSSDWIYPGEGRYRGTLPDRPNYPTVNHGKSIPVVYGTERVTPRVVLWQAMGTAELWKGDGVFPWKTYWGPAATAVLAICEAPVTQVGFMFIDGLGFSPLPSNMFYRAVAKDSSFTWVLVDNSTTSPAFLASTPAAGMAFQGTCYFAAQYLRTDNGKMPNITFQVTGRCAGGAGGGAVAADVVIDILTNARYGAGLDPAQVVTDVGLDGTAASSYRTYCTAMGWSVSRTIQEQEDAASLLRDLLLCTNAEAVFTDGKLVIVPLGDVTVGGYVPPAPILLDQNEMLFEPGNDPVLISRTSESEVFNYFPIRIRNRNAGYNVSEYVAEDFAHSSVYGQRAADGYDAKWITDPALALKLSSLFAQQSITARNTYRFKLKARWALLDQMDVIAITEPVTGLSQVRCRIRSIRKTSDGSIEVEAVEAPLGTATPIDLTPQTEDGYAGESVTVTQIAETALTDFTNVGDGTVPGAKIVDASVTTGQVADDAITMAKLSVDAVRSADYAEDLSGNATAGFKLFAGGTGIVGKIGAGGVKVGAYALDEAVLATLTAVARTGTASVTDLCWYRGNATGVPKLYTAASWAATTAYAGGEDVVAGGARVYACVAAGTSGGSAPTSTTFGVDITDGSATWRYMGTVANIGERLAIQSAVTPGVDTNTWLITLKFRLRSSIFDSHDSLRYMTGLLYDSSGDLATNDPGNEIRVPVPDRMYRSQVAHWDALNDVYWTTNHLWWSTASPRFGSSPFAFNGYIQVRLYNAFGYSASRNYQLASNSLTAFMTAGVTIPGANAPPPSGGSGGGSGGACVAPETRILMADGREVAAGALRVGDLLWTLPDGQRADVEWGGFAVADVSQHHSQRVAVAFSDGRRLVCSTLHRVLLGDGRGYVSASLLRAGDRVCGAPGRSGDVARVDQAQDGEVVKITVDGAGTYVSGGLLSHNVKPRT